MWQLSLAQLSAPNQTMFFHTQDKIYTPFYTYARARLVEYLCSIAPSLRQRSYRSRAPTHHNDNPTITYHSLLPHATDTLPSLCLHWNNIRFFLQYELKYLSHSEYLDYLRNNLRVHAPQAIPSRVLRSNSRE